MGLSKTSQYDDQEMKLYKISKAIAHPARIRILKHLRISGQIDLRELLTVLKLSASTIREHLRILEDVDLVTVESIGNIGVVFLIKTTTISDLNDEISDLKKFINVKMTRSERRIHQRQQTKPRAILRL
jgi:ArsR family transcriptional regulator, arsenate/arsenite/antimonite-responsive transcriptional repressor